MAHRQPRHAKSLKRSAAGREMYDRVLVVCEGTKTERAYFNEIRNKLELSTANVEVTPADRSDPMSIVRYAKDLQKISARQGNRYDHIYCVLTEISTENFKTLIYNYILILVVNSIVRVLGLVSSFGSFCTSNISVNPSWLHKINPLHKIVSQY